MLTLTAVRDRLGRDPRLARILHGGFSAIVSRGFGLLVSALSLPLTVRYLGPQRYGIWVTVSTTISMLSFMDLGIANSLTNVISNAYATGDRQSAQRYYSCAVWITVALCAVLGAVAWLAWPYMHWGSLFHLSDPAAIREASLCVAVGIAFFLLSLPLNLINKVLSGYQQTQISNYVNVLSSVLGLLAIIVLIHVHGSLLMLMVLYSSALLAGVLGLNLWVNFYDKRWLVPNPRLLSRTKAKDLMNSGFSFFVLQLAGLVVFNSDNLIITHYLGAAEVAPYSVTWRLAGYAAVLQTAIFPSLWPAYAEAYARRDFGWVRRTFWRTVRFAMGSTAAAVVLMSIFGRSLISWYVSPAVVPSEVLLVAVCGWTLMSAGMNLEACLLAAVNRVKWQGILSVIAAGVNIVISIYLVQRIGALGVILGTIISYLLVLVGPQTVIVWRALYRPPDEPVPTSAPATVERSRPGGFGSIYREQVQFFARASAAQGFRLVVRLGAAIGLIPRAKASEASKPQRFLVVALGGFLGDAIMLLPMIEALRQTYPDARIECVVEPAPGLLLRMVESLDRVHTIALGPPPVTRTSELKRVFAITGYYWRNLRSYRPHICIAPRWGDDPFRSLILACLSRAPRRVGFAANSYNTKKRPATYRNRFLTHVVPGGDGMHEPAKFLYLLEQAGVIAAVDRHQISDRPNATLAKIAAELNWPALAHRLGIEPNAQFAVVAPGASAARRRWPLEEWASLVEHLEVNLGLVSVLVAGPQDAQLARDLDSLTPCRTIVVAGTTSIPESVTLISRAAIFFGSDSGPGHIAGALGIPSLILFTSAEGGEPNDAASPERIRPMGPYVSACRPAASLRPCPGVCAAEDAHCIREINPFNVIRAVDELLARVGERPRAVLQHVPESQAQLTL